MLLSQTTLADADSTYNVRRQHIEQRRMLPRFPTPEGTVVKARNKLLETTDLVKDLRSQLRGKDLEIAELKKQIQEKDRLLELKERELKEERNKNKKLTEQLKSANTALDDVLKENENLIEKINDANYATKQAEQRAEQLALELIEANKKITNLKKELTFARAHTELSSGNAFSVTSIVFDPNFDDRGYINLKIISKNLAELLKLSSDNSVKVKIGISPNSIIRWDSELNKTEIPLDLQRIGRNKEPTAKIISTPTELIYGSSIRLYFEEDSSGKTNSQNLKRKRHYSFDVSIWVVEEGIANPILINTLSTIGFMPSKSRGSGLQIDMENLNENILKTYLKGF